MSQPAPLVVRISPMAHIAVGFITLGIFALIYALPSWSWVLMVVPVLASTVIARYRTVAGPDEVTARTMFGSTTVPWTEIDGLRFTRSSWAKARLTDGREITLPAVTFATLPLLTAASGGRVPNPYA
ncbi:PH domain-containing protein [Mycolicibacterium bacteremicum]|uniref:PH domain-containing protein n=1 Tax=Mycolicibacterium bacteremicum TaxID=564198 RepID=UPI0026EBFCF2|nr:PH domain-containing protein [Mycolicibacterium bacteremicum]